MVFCGRGGTSTSPETGAGAGALSCPTSGCLGAGAGAAFLVFLAVFVGLVVFAWTFLMHELRALALFSFWQLAVPALGLAVGAGLGMGAGAPSSWAKEGAAKATAIRAAMPAISRRIVVFSWAAFVRGINAASSYTKILLYLWCLCQFPNSLLYLQNGGFRRVQAILNVALPIFGIILTGYLAGRWRILGGESTAALNAFVSYFALPVLFFGALARTPVAAVLDPALTLGFSVAVVATFALGMASTWMMARLAGARGGLAAMSLQGIAASWGNVGYMGVPLCLAAFGEASLPPAMLTVIVTAVVSMVFGVMLIELEVAAGHGPLRTFLRAAFNVARNPLPLSIALGMVASAVGIVLPTPVEKWLDLLGAAAAPCALFAIGLFLSDRSVRSGLAEASLATVIKLLLQPLLAWLVLPYFVDLSSVPGKVALLMTALPTAANAFVLAKQFDISVEQNSASVLLSTAFSVVTVSALLVLLRVS